MPGWLISALISMILKFGLPPVLTWLHSKFPWIPVSDDFIQVLKDIVQKLTEHKANKQAILADGKAKLMACVGQSCPTPAAPPWRDSVHDH